MTARRRHRTRRRPARALAAGALAVIVPAGCVDAGPQRPAATSGAAAAHAAARAFLDTYVAADGRVLRPDQGGDTVSEGQAYALLLAAAIGDGARVRAVWAWTAAHLRRPDGLLSYHYGGQPPRILDPAPAADADVQAAWALVLAGRRLREEALTRAGVDLARAVADHEVTYDARGEPLLAAGTWALRPPQTINPSYFTPSAFQALAAVTGDRRWQQLAAGAAGWAQAATGGRVLPPNWAELRGPGDLAATDGPGLPAGPTRGAYGLDAARLPLWFAASCAAADRRWAAGLTPLAQATGAQPQTRGTDAAVRDANASVLPTLAAAAVAAARGDVGRRDALIATARTVAAAFPGYYGAAWLALGQVLLNTADLGTCPPPGPT